MDGIDSILMVGACQEIRDSESQKCHSGPSSCYREEAAMLLLLSDKV